MGEGLLLVAIAIYDVNEDDRKVIFMGNSARKDIRES